MCRQGTVLIVIIVARDKGKATTIKEISGYLILAVTVTIN